MAQRKKLSTTIAPDNYSYLHRLVKTGKADSVGDAVDKAVEPWFFPCQRTFHYNS